ncbi:MAG: efflux RND transporter periplasmic adaptor subunit [bacterium]
MKNNVKKNREKTQKLIIIAAVVLIATGGFFYLRAKRSANGKEVIRTANVEFGPVISSVSGNGVLQPLTTVDVKSNVGGQVVEFAVDEGDTVKTGQLIARIDPKDAETALRQAEVSFDMQSRQSAAQLKSAGFSLESARTRLAQTLESLDAQPELTRASLEQAQSSFDYAQKDLQRQKGLLANGFVSKGVVDSAQQRYDSAKAQLDTAKANNIQIKLKQMDVDSARSAVKVAEANLESSKAAQRQIEIKSEDVANARTQLGYTTVTAPRDGVVVKKYVEVGSIVTAGKSSFSGSGAGVTIVTLADTTRMLALVNVDETDIAKIKIGQRVKVSLDAYPDERFRGEVTKIAPQATMAQNVTTVPVTVEIMNPNSELKVGMNATCDFITGMARHVLSVPNEAINNTPMGKSVTMLKNDKKVPRKVEVGLEGNDYTEIISGLKEGEKVITSIYTPTPATAGAAQAGQGQGQGGQGQGRQGQGGSRQGGSRGGAGGHRPPMGFGGMH